MHYSREDGKWCWMQLFRDVVLSHQSDLETFTKQRGNGSLPKIPENGVIFGREFEFFTAEAVASIDERLNQTPDLNFARRTEEVIASGQIQAVKEPTSQQRQIEFWQSWRNWVVALRNKVNSWNEISGKKQRWDAVSSIVNECTAAWGQVNHRWHDARSRRHKIFGHLMTAREPYHLSCRMPFALQSRRSNKSSTRSISGARTIAT